MRAYSTASGGVMFVPDTIARKQKPVASKGLSVVAYADLSDDIVRAQRYYADAGRPLMGDDFEFDMAADDLLKASF